MESKNFATEVPGVKQLLIAFQVTQGQGQVSPINRVHLGYSRRSDGCSLSQMGFTLDFSWNFLGRVKLLH